MKKSVQSERNKAAVDLNSLKYVPYKCCPAIIDTFYKIFKKIWTTRGVPVSLLSKSDDARNPAEFRPITITNKIGKVFFSIVSKRLEKFTVRDSFIDSTQQKGFLSDVPGCIEHSFPCSNC